MTKTSKLVDRQKMHIKHGLAQCTHEQRVLFAKMYGPQEYLNDNFLFNVEKIAELHMDDVVNKMPDNKLHWAALQVEETIQKNRNDT